MFWNTAILGNDDWSVPLPPAVTDWDQPDADPEYEASPQQHPFREIPGPPVWGPATWRAPRRADVLPGSHRDPCGLTLPSPQSCRRGAPLSGSLAEVPKAGFRSFWRKNYSILLSLRVPPPRDADGELQDEARRRQGPSWGHAGAEAGEGLPSLSAPAPALPSARSCPGTSPASGEQQFPRGRRGRGNLLLLPFRCPRRPINQVPPNEVSR